MPKYEYKCSDDETHIMEEIRSIDQRDDDMTCACGSYMYRVVISSVGVQFKGSGFYVTDNRR